MTEAESIAAFVKQVNFGLSSIKWGLPLLAVTFTLLFVLVRWPKWEIFAQRKKWVSRILLFVVTLVLVLPTVLAQQWTLAFMPGRIELEKPSLTVTAIKLGAYGLVWGHEFQSQLSPEKQELAKCVEALSRSEAQSYQNKCGDNRACFENIPTMSREDIVSKIKESQKTQVPLVSPVCKSVDVAKLQTI